MAAAADKNFTWSDEEINLLLHVVIDYKAGKAGEGVDWESVRSKYEDVTKMFLEKYSDDDKEKFPRRTEAFPSVGCFVSCTCSPRNSSV